LYKSFALATVNEINEGFYDLKIPQIILQIDRILSSEEDGSVVLSLKVSERNSFVIWSIVFFIIFGFSGSQREIKWFLSERRNGEDQDSLSQSSASNGFFPSLKKCEFHSFHSIHEFNVLSFLFNFHFSGFYICRSKSFQEIPKHHESLHLANPQ
jgi:hypothetical protein